MKNVKFKIDNKVVAKLVTDKIKALATEGEILYPLVYPNEFSIEPLYVYIDNEGRVTYDLDELTFERVKETQIHYLHFLTGTTDGRLFTNDITDNIYLQLGDTAYWIDIYTGQLEWHPFNLSKTLKMLNGNWLIDVNEKAL
tara:strand:- start:33949 stop:34371 length:423 start_codon:yes stop_codon:yes gene_type:complete